MIYLSKRSYTPMSHERPEGVTDAEWERFNHDVARVEKALVIRICPDCRSPLSKKLDPKQDEGGVWFLYRCSNHRCNFSVDRCEYN